MESGRRFIPAGGPRENEARAAHCREKDATFVTCGREVKPESAFLKAVAGVPRSGYQWVAGIRTRGWRGDSISRQQRPAGGVAGEEFIGERAIGLGTEAAGVVLENGFPVAGSFADANRAGDHRTVHLFREKP